MADAGEDTLDYFDMVVGMRFRVEEEERRVVRKDAREGSVTKVLNWLRRGRGFEMNR